MDERSGITATQIIVETDSKDTATRMVYAWLRSFDNKTDLDARQVVLADIDAALKHLPPPCAISDLVDYMIKMKSRKPFTVTVQVHYADEIGRKGSKHNANYWISEAARQAVYEVLREASGVGRINPVDFDNLDLQDGVITLQMSLDRGVTATFKDRLYQLLEKHPE